MIADTSGPLTQGLTRQQQRSVVVPVAVARLRYRAVWRSKQLLIFPIDCHPFRQSVSAVLEGDRHRLLSCLRHSPVRRLLLSPELPLVELLFWTELGRDAGLPVYLRRSVQRGRKNSWPKSLLLRWGDVIGASVSLALLSPAMLLIALRLLVSAGRVFDREWCVGRDGKLFRALRFATIPESSLKNKRVGVTELPLLVNILRGETTLLAETLPLSDTGLVKSKTWAAM